MPHLYRSYISMLLKNRNSIGDSCSYSLTDGNPYSDKPIMKVSVAERDVEKSMLVVTEISITPPKDI